jgi:predicted ATP-dependent endonuclease of OLD family
MRLKRARVTNYKSIDDSTWVDFENITCLVGKNESGKTAFLHALRNLSPVEGFNGNFDSLDYPRKGYAKYKHTHDAAPATVVSAEFELTDEELGILERAYGTGVLKSKMFTLSKNYKNDRTCDFETDEKAVVRHLVATSGLSSELSAEASLELTVNSLIANLEVMQDKPPSANEMLAKLKESYKKNLSQQIIDGYLMNWIPRFFYFDDYSVMQGRISIQNLLARKAQKKIDASDQTFFALLDLVGVDLKEVGEEKNYERMKAALEAGSISITDEMFKFWSQNKQLEVEFDLSNANPSDVAPLNEGTILHVRIKNNRHRVTVPFDQRSKGFVWFFSFLTYFSQLEGKTDLLLLLDEPGLSLHAKAQGDFLRFIEERLAPKYQVVYTTHSPFMIDSSHLERTRTVQDIDEKGTTISADVLRNDRDTVFPLQAALGYDLAQTLFIGPNCLLVEGPSDLIYLQLLNDAAGKAGKTQLDPRWVIIPVGGADKISTFLSLLGANKLNVAVLMDVSSKDKQRIQNLQANGLLGKSNLVQINEFTGSADADIEDLFEPDFYIQLVNGAYEPATKVTTTGLGVGNPRIVKRIGDYFAKSGLGTFSHYAPSVFFLKQQATLLPTLDTATVEKSSKMFDRLKALLPQA